MPQVLVVVAVFGSKIVEGVKAIGRLFKKGFQKLLQGAERKALASGMEIAENKFDYLFGEVESNAHNAARSNQLALEMERLGVQDTAAGREILSEHFAQAASSEGNVVRTFSNEYGNFEVRDSLFIGPSGQAVRFETTFLVTADGTRRFATTIPFRKAW